MIEKKIIDRINELLQEENFLIINNECIIDSRNIKIFFDGGETEELEFFLHTIKQYNIDDMAFSEELKNNEEFYQYYYKYFIISLNYIKTSDLHSLEAENNKENKIKSMNRIGLKILGYNFGVFNKVYYFLYKIQKNQINVKGIEKLRIDIFLRYFYDEENFKYNKNKIIIYATSKNFAIFNINKNNIELIKV